MKNRACAAVTPWGYTFIELVLVTIIILILVGLSTPLFKKPFSGIQLKNTCQNLAQLMRYLQAASIAERRFYRINFDFAEGAFWATAQDDNFSDNFKRLSGRWGKVFDVPEGISIDGESAFITFYPNGSADKAQIKLSNKEGKTFTISVLKNVGRIKITE